MAQIRQTLDVIRRYRGNFPYVPINPEIKFSPLQEVLSCEETIKIIENRSGLVYAEETHDITTLGEVVMPLEEDSRDVDSTPGTPRTLDKSIQGLVA
ncbi:hypothetical protein Tco_1138704 [Tanacetum coccineum]